MNWDNLARDLELEMHNKEDCWKAVAMLQKEFPQFFCFPTGSAIINGAGDDIDIVVKCRQRDVKKFLNAGFIEAPDGYPDDGWKSLRRKEVNLILVFSEKEVTRWRTATAACRVLSSFNIQPPKDLRIAIFESIRGNIL